MSERPAPTSSRRLRTDIQGLRAVAVACVVLYHLWPHRFPGGFVGVDVFFVISGFLITAHLLAEPPRRPADVLAFWVRRIHRLLPTALTVLAVTLLATRLLAPETLWADTARQVRAAALYVVNWRLAGDAVDYSAAESAATPVQHFWSLSVEEQFYLGWPLLVAALALVATRRRRTDLEAVRAGVLTVVALSLGYGLWLTASDPARAYFVTSTRLWELAVGGLLATMVATRAQTAGRRPREPLWRRIAITWAGLAAVVWSAATYSLDTPFPGWHALVPVLGTAAVLATADPRGWWAPGRVLASRGLQWLGGASYSVYLWHWPLVVLVPFVTGSSPGWVTPTVVVAATLVLAAATRRHVEDRFRTPRPGQRRWVPVAAAAAGMAGVVALASLQLSEVAARRQADEQRLAAALAHSGRCLGAAALATPGCPTRPVGDIVPSPAQAVGDRYDEHHTLLHSQQCWLPRRAVELRTCSFGRASGSVRVAVVGNSHAAQWMAALDTVAAQRGWRLTTFFAHNCALAATPQDLGNAQESAVCGEWVRRTTDRLAEGGFDLIVLSNRVSKPPAGQPAVTSRAAFAAGYAAVLRRWQAAGATVVAIRDTPWPGATVGDVPACLAEHEHDPAACSGARSAWVAEDPVVAAVHSLDDPHVQVVDLTDRICGPERCQPVVGGVVVWSDFSHLTTTYVQTLTPYLERSLTSALRRSGQ